MLRAASMKSSSDIPATEAIRATFAASRLCSGNLVRLPKRFQTVARRTKFKAGRTTSGFSLRLFCFMTTGCERLCADRRGLQARNEARRRKGGQPFIVAQWQ
jgi:hypothetical protein